MEGVLSVLGLEQAALAVMHMRELTQEILQPQAEEDPARTAARSDRLGNNLGALSFLIDMLNYQPALVRKVFVYNPLKGKLQSAG